MLCILFKGTELEEVGPEVQAYHEALSAIVVVTVAAALLLRHLDTGHHHQLNGEGCPVVEHRLEAGAHMNQGLHPHHLLEGPASQSQNPSQGQGLDHRPEALLLRKVSSLMEMVLPTLVRSEEVMFGEMG